MPDTAFIVTIDAEGDDLWSRPRRITTRNARYLPRFQRLCERHGCKPVYLANYEMADCDAFVEFGRDVLARGAGEIGMHLHAWNSPPLEPLTDDDFRHQPYLTEYPLPLMREKIRRVTGLLEERFGRKMVSHRGGRFAFDARYAALLADEGYRVDCSVTPGIDWSGTPGDPAGDGGADYSGAPREPHFLGSLLEVPVTIRPSCLYRLAPWAYRVPLLRSLAHRIAPGLSWLAPAENGLRAMLAAARAAKAERPAHLEFMLHSSELMPGGSPSFRTVRDIERLYEDMEVLFGELASWCRGMTLEEFDSRMRMEAS
jgi:hypothetical protein